MKKVVIGRNSILVKGEDKLAFSVTACLLKGGYNVTLYTTDVQKAFDCLNIHKHDIESVSSCTLNLDNLNIADRFTASDYYLAIAITSENIVEKQSVIKELEQKLSNKVLIAINTESIALSDLHTNAQNPERIIGANWVEPAHTTLFLEILYNGPGNKKYAEKFCDTAKLTLHKDPYAVVNFSIRAKLMTALIREAGYLIQNGYATVEDIDRACRNDPGYYMSFAGNFRYMDLMGTNSYGMVMKDLNRELGKDSDIPECFKEIIKKGGLGMQNNQGFYNYNDGDTEKWDAVFRKFSYEIQNIINKYPFNYNDKVAEMTGTPVNKKEDHLASEMLIEEVNA